MSRSAHLEVVAGLVEQHIPIYEQGQWNPVKAAETGHGSCFSKNVFGAIILELVSDVNTASAISWGNKQHPKEPSGFMLDTQTKRPGHSSLLVGTSGQPFHVRQISFNEQYRRSDAWHIREFNDPDEDPYAMYSDGKLIATNTGNSLGLRILPWYQAGQAYTEVLGIHDSVFHTMSETAIREVVVETLRVDAIKRELPRIFGS